MKTLLATVCITGMAVVAAYVWMAYDIETNTVYSSGFSRSGWKSVRIGMQKDSVLCLLGVPQDETTSVIPIASLSPLSQRMKPIRWGVPFLLTSAVSSIADDGESTTVQRLTYSTCRDCDGVYRVFEVWCDSNGVVWDVREDIVD